MYCSTCGSRVADGRAICQVCGAVVAPSRMPVPAAQPAYAAEAMQVCPRCAYRGTSASFFSRGGHVAALIALGVMTAPMMCLGAVGYFLWRHNHRVCPRCGMHWGPNGVRALMLSPGGGTASMQMQMNESAIPVTGSAKKGWAIALLIFGAIMLTAGIANLEIPPILFGLLAGGGGGVLLNASKNDREQRREAIIQSLQLPVLQLAGRKGGRLTVTDVATEMGWPMARAEKVLNSLDDGLRVMSDITDDGVIVYDFLELRAAQLGTGGAQPNALRA
jgi:hypothetical protein